MTTSRTTDTKATGQYAKVNGLNLYYETHGAGRPLILLHGGLMSNETFGPVLPLLAERHQVIAPRPARARPDCRHRSTNRRWADGRRHRRPYRPSGA